MKIKVAARSAWPDLANWLGKVHQGDCIDLMDQMPEASVDLIVTSPPYNIKNSTGNGLKNGSGGKWPQAELIKGYASHDDAMPHEDVRSVAAAIALSSDDARPQRRRRDLLQS